MTSLYPVAGTSEFVPENTASNITSNDVVSTTGAGSSNDLLLFGLLANKSTAVIVILSGLVLAGLIFMVCRLLVKTQALYKPSSSTRHESLAATSDIFDREAIFQWSIRYWLRHTAIVPIGLQHQTWSSFKNPKSRLASIRTPPQCSFSGNVSAKSVERRKAT